MFKPLFDFECPNILIYDKLDSTSSEAKKIINSGHAEHGLIIWAKKQLNGHGRYGANWDSGEGNLTFSFVIDNERSFNKIAVYPFVTALAIKASLEKHLDQSQMNQLSFKWPNDILFAGKKIAGIIFESEIQNQKISKIICGIGLNIASSPKGLQFATSLSNEGIEQIKIDELLFSIIINFDNYMNEAEQQGDEYIYKKWMESAYKLNEEIIVMSGSEEIRGVFLGIEQGNIIIENKQLGRKLISTGNVFFSEKEKITTIFNNLDVKNITFLKSYKAKSE